jgi:methylthioribose-1-phosphate isomerase
MAELKTVEWVNGRVRMIDQTRLPYRFVYVHLKDYRQVSKAIREMVVRGAPAIGVAAAMGMALAAKANRGKSRDRLFMELERAAEALRASRPTAQNLFWAVDRVLQRAHDTSLGGDVAAAVIEEARKMAEEDVQANLAIGRHGAGLIADGDQVLTHCNTGTLATVNYGTALAPIRTAVRQGKKVRVVATETRPRFQGAKLTAYELLSDKIPVTLIVDGAVGYVMMRGMVQKAIVGADRITTKFVANKVGTYLIALAAQANKIPFYVAAPTSTFDLRRESSEVKVEERNAQEVTHINGRRVAPRDVPVYNPAFDLTPIALVNGFITEKGLITPNRLAADPSSIQARRA